MDAGWIWFTILLWISGEGMGGLRELGGYARERSFIKSPKPLPLFRASTVGLPSRSARFITSSSSTSRTPWASKALPAGSEDVTDNTSSSRSSLSSAAVEREMKNSSLSKLVRKLHLRSPRTQSLHCLSSGWTRAAGGRWSPQFSREKGTTESGAFSHRKKAHNERTPFPREQSARALRPNT